MFAIPERSPRSQVPLTGWDKAIGRATNNELAEQFREWLICQRYSRTTHGVYNRVVARLLRYCGRRRVASLTHLDIRAFISEVSERDLSADVVHRYIWALRSFFDFLCLNGLVIEVAPRLIRPRPLPRTILRALSQANVRRLLHGAKSSRDILCDRLPHHGDDQYSSRACRF